MDKLVQMLNSIPVKLMQAVKNMQKKSSSASVTSQPVPNHSTSQPQAQPAPVYQAQQAGHQEPAVSSSDQVNAKPTPSPLSKLPIKKIAIAFGAIIAFLVILSIVMKLLPKASQILPTGATPTPTSVATPVATPTQYHDNPEVINLEQNTKTLDDQIKNIQLDETNLKPRPLDFDVSFK